jgi:stress-induced morphogen
MFRSPVFHFAHKWAAPPSPNMDAIKKSVNTHLSPVYFSIRNDVAAGPWNTDQNFYGLICSPKFEGKSYEQMYAMLQELIEPLGLNGRCRFSLEPPSRWNVCLSTFFAYIDSRNYIERNVGNGGSTHK